MRPLRVLVLLAAGVCWTASHAAADTITAGSLSWSGGSGQSISLQGSSFTFNGNVSISGGIFKPFDCGEPTCVAGSEVDLLAHWIDNDLPGTAVLDGRTFNGVGGVMANSFMSATWTGAAAIPLDFTGGLLTAPFTFSGLFSYVDGALRTDLLLRGSGIVSLMFAPHLTPGAFAITSASYDFSESDAAATPEPMSLLLIGTGLAGLALRARMRRPPA